MIPVSNEWKNAVEAQFRYQAYMKVRIVVTPPELRVGTTVTASSTHANTLPQIVLDGIFDAPQPYASVEHNRWLLNGQYNLISNSMTRFEDWWSQVTSGIVTLSFEFNKEYTIPGVYIQFDLENNTWPRWVQVQAYNASGSKRYDRVFNGVIDASTFFLDMPMDFVKHVDIKLNNWSIPGWRYRVNQVLFGNIIHYDSIGGGRIMSSTFNDKAHPLAKDLPQHEGTVTMRNIDGEFDPLLQRGLSRYLARKQAFHVRWGFNTTVDKTEWLDEQLYYIESVDIPADSKNVTFNLSNKLAFLTDEYKHNNFNNQERSFKALALEVLQNSNVIYEDSLDIPWIFCQKLDNYTTKAPTPKGIVNTVLQLIANASGVWLVIDGETGKIEFKQDSTNVVHSIGTMQELGDPSIQLRDKLRSIKVNLYNYVYNDEIIVLNTTEGRFSGTNTIELEYNVEYAGHTTATITGGTITNVQYYTSYCILTFNCATNAQVTIEIKGKELKSSATAIETYKDPAMDFGLDIVIDNPLITNMNVVNMISARVKTYYSNQIQYTVPYIGYPELEAADKIAFSTVYGSSTSTVQANNISFNGGWNGTVIVE